MGRVRKGEERKVKVRKRGWRRKEGKLKSTGVRLRLVCGGGGLSKFKG